MMQDVNLNRDAFCKKYRRHEVDYSCFGSSMRVFIKQLLTSNNLYLTSNMYLVKYLLNAFNL